MDEEDVMDEESEFADACGKLIFYSEYFKDGMQDVMDLYGIIDCGIAAASEICKKNLRFKYVGEYPTYYDDNGEVKRLRASTLYKFDDDCKFLYDKLSDIIFYSDVINSDYVKNNRFLANLINNFKKECEKGKHFVFKDSDEYSACDELIRRCAYMVLTIWKNKEEGIYQPSDEVEYSKILSCYEELKSYFDDKECYFEEEKNINKKSRKIYQKFITSCFDIIESANNFDISYKESDKTLGEESNKVYTKSSIQ